MIKDYTMLQLRFNFKSLTSENPYLACVHDSSHWKRKIGLSCSLEFLRQNNGGFYIDQVDIDNTVAIKRMFANIGATRFQYMGR